MQTRRLAVKTHGIFASRIPILKSRTEFTTEPVVVNKEDPIHLLGKNLKVKEEYQPSSNFINLEKLLSQERENCENYRSKTRWRQRINPDVLVISLERRLAFAAALMQALSILHDGGEMFGCMKAEYIHFDGYLNTVIFDVPKGVNWEDKFGLIGDVWKDGEEEFLLHPALDIQEMVRLLACLLLGDHDYDQQRPKDPRFLATLLRQVWPKSVLNLINNLMVDMINLSRTPSNVSNCFAKLYMQAADNCYKNLAVIKTMYQQLSTPKQDSYFSRTELKVEEVNKMRGCRS